MADPRYGGAGPRGRLGKYEETKTTKTTEERTEVVNQGGSSAQSAEQAEYAQEAVESAHDADEQAEASAQAPEPDTEEDLAVEGEESEEESDEDSEDNESDGDEESDEGSEEDNNGSDEDPDSIKGDSSDLAGDDDVKADTGDLAGDDDVKDGSDEDDSDGDGDSGKTGFNGTDEGDDDSGDKKESAGAKAAKAGTKAAAGAAAPIAAQIAAFLAFLKFLKSLVASAIAAAANSFLAKAIAFAMAVGKAIVNAVAAVGSFISSALGIGAAATIGILVAPLLLIGGLIAGAIGDSSGGAEDAANSNDCVATAEKAVANAEEAKEASKAELDKKTEENAKKVYAILAGMGMPDENIAGILGNWTVESGVDPTSVETIFNEPHQIGKRKKQAEKDGFKVEKIDKDYAARYSAIKLVGIGLGQWTNGRNTMLLDYAKMTKKPWYELETQLGFMVSKDDPVRVKQIKALVKGEAGGSVDEATTYFVNKWEGVPGDKIALRKEAAGKWYAKMGGWEADKDLADSILKQSNTSIGTAIVNEMFGALIECQTSGVNANANNGDLAEAAATFAWPYYDDAKGNDGTDAYKFLRKKLWPGNPYYASCDSTVGTAVRWSGADDNYPSNSVATQLAYLQNGGGGKWEKVKDFNGDKSKLKPGDVLLRNDGSVSHTVMYTGEDAIKNVWGEGNYEPNGDLVSGSLNNRSPSVSLWYEGPRGLNTGYVAYRNVKKEESPKYKDIKIPKDIKLGEGDKNVLTTPGPTRAGE